MPDRSASQAYELLLRSLQENRLGWVAAQVQEQVRSGKPATKYVAPYHEEDSRDFVSEDFIPSAPKKGRRQRLAATDDFSPEERLELVLSAIESAVIHTADIETELIGFFPSQNEAPADVRFEPGEFD